MPRDYDDTRLRYCPKCGHRWALPPEPRNTVCSGLAVDAGAGALACAVVYGVFWLLGWL